jgi:hypothetical protein
MRVTAAHSSDLARRVAHRRQELGLTYEEVAHRGGMDPSYLEYLEHSSSVALDHGYGRTCTLPPPCGRAHYAATSL